MDYRENAGYIITDSCHVGDSEFVLGVHLTAPQQFVTWKCTDRKDYYWGHYFSDLFSAQKDLVARAQEEVQCLEEQRQDAIAPEAPPYSPWGNVQECEMLCPGCKPRTPIACPISFDQFPIKSALYTVFGKPISCKCRIAIANIILMKI